MLVHPWTAAMADAQDLPFGKPEPERLDWLAFTFDAEPIHATPATIPPPVLRCETGIAPPRAAPANPFGLLSLRGAPLTDFGEALLSGKRRRRGSRSSAAFASDDDDDDNEGRARKSPRSSISASVLRQRAHGMSFDSASSNEVVSSDEEEEDAADDEENDENAARDDSDDDYRAHGRKQRSGKARKQRAAPREQPEHGEFLVGRWSPDEVAMVMHITLVYIEHDLKVIADISNFCEVKRPRRAIDKQLKRMLKYERWIGRSGDSLLRQIRELIESRSLPPLNAHQRGLLEAARKQWRP